MKYRIIEAGNKFMIQCQSGPRKHWRNYLSEWEPLFESHKEAQDQIDEIVKIQAMPEQEFFAYLKSIF